MPKGGGAMRINSSWPASGLPKNPKTWPLTKTEAVSLRCRSMNPEALTRTSGTRSKTVCMTSPTRVMMLDAGVLF